MRSKYTPRLRPLVPVGHDCWLAVSRVKNPGIGQGFENATVDQQIEWLLRAITQPGADQSQRQYDLETLADLIVKARGEKVVMGRNSKGEPNQWTYQGGTPGWGYGVAPIDSDTHDHSCVVCRGNNEEPIFDGHPYTMRGFCDSHDGLHQYRVDPDACLSGWRDATEEELS